MLTIDIEGDDFAVLYKQVRAFDVELGKSLRKQLTAEGNKVRDDVRKAALAIPSRSLGGNTAYRKKRGSADGGASFRQGIAAATETKVSPSRPGYFSIRIRVSGSKFKAKTGKPVTLPRYMEGLSKKSWRHPVWVKRENLPGVRPWAAQSSHPFLLPTAMRHKAATQEAVKKALQEAVDTVLNTKAA